MSIASELTRLQQAKADIKAAIEAKGVEVPSSALIDTYDDYIAQIEGGGGCSVASANSITFDAMGRISSVEYKEGVTSIPDYMFYGNSSLTSVTFPSTLTSIGVGAFEHCTGLTSLIIPSSVTYINAEAFYGCSGLTGITVEATTPPALGGSNVFDLTNNCPIYVSCASAAAYQIAWSDYASRIVACDGAKYVFYGTNGNLVQSGACNGSGDLGVYGGDSYDLTVRGQVKTAIVGECVTSLTNSFSNCSAMTDVAILGTGLTAINEYAFNWCYALTGLTIPSTVDTLGQQAFQSCRSLTSVNLPSGVTYIPVYCFSNCWSLTGVSMPNVTNIGNDAFEYCSGMTSITLPTGLTDIGDEVFVGCSGLTSITIPASVTSIGTAAFLTCIGLTGITVEATTPPTIGNDVFSDTNDCPIYVPIGTLSAYQSAWSNYASRLVEMSSCDCQYNFCGEDELGEEFTVNNGTNEIKSTDFDSHSPVRGTVGSLTTTIREYCFGRSLEEITLCDSVTTIEHEAFMECENLLEVTIPDSVTGIGFYAFTRCYSLKEVIFEGTTPPTFLDGDGEPTLREPIYWGHFPSVTYVPDSALSAYRAIPNWVGDVHEEQFDPYVNIKPISERV